MIRRRRALLGMVGVVLKAVEIAGMYKEHPVTVGEVPPEQFPEFFTYSTEQFSTREHRIACTVCAYRALEIVTKWISSQCNPPKWIYAGALSSDVENRKARIVQPLKIAPSKDISTEYQVM